MSNKFGVKQVADITFYDLVTGKPILFLDTLKMTNIENKATTSYARGGKGNPKLMAFDFDRESTLKMQDALMSLKSISMLAGMAGNSSLKGATNAYKREVLLSVTGATGKSKVTVAQTPVAGSVTAFLVSDDATSIASTTVAVSDVSFDIVDVPVGTQVVVYYQFSTAVTSETITINAGHFPGYVKVVGDTVIRNVNTGLDEAFQMIIGKAKIAPTFNLTFQADGDPSVFEFDLEVFAQDGTKDMIQLIKY